MIRKQLMFTTLFTLIMALSGIEIQAAAAPEYFKPRSKKDLKFDNERFSPKSLRLDPYEEAETYRGAALNLERMSGTTMTNKDRQRMNWIISNWSEYWSKHLGWDREQQDDLEIPINYISDEESN